MRRMLQRQWPVGVIQICWIAPESWISASWRVSPGTITIDGESFQPRPRSRAARAPVPSVVIPPFPFSPVKFSGLIERDCAGDRRERLPRCIPRPLNPGTHASVLFHRLRRQNLVLPHDRAVVASAILDRADLRIVVDVDDAEAPRVAPGPLEVIHQ